MCKKNILIADDEPDLVYLLQAFIQEHYPHYLVFPAIDGSQVLDILNNVQIDILFLDLNLPKIHGRRILADINLLKLAHRPKNIFVITAENSSDIQINTGGRNICYFGKPVDFKKLKEYLDAINNSPDGVEVKPAKTLDMTLLNPFIDSTLKVLEITTGTIAVKEAVNVVADESFKEDISAFYPIFSPIFEGFFCLSFPLATYLEITSRMLFQDFKEITQQNRDGVGELCNQIFGNAKAYFNEKFKTQIQMASPSIIIGSGHQVLNLSKSPRVVLKFNTECGHFYIEVAIQKIG